MSGGTEGALSPHFLVLEAREVDEPREVGRARARPRAHAAAGRPSNSAVSNRSTASPKGVRAAMRDGGIDSADSVHFAQVKCPLLTSERVAEATARGGAVATRDTLKSMAPVAGGLGARRRGRARRDRSRRLVRGRDRPRLVALFLARLGVGGGRARRTTKSSCSAPARAGADRSASPIASCATRSTSSRCAPRSARSDLAAPGQLGGAERGARRRPARQGRGELRRDVCAAIATRCSAIPIFPRRGTRAAFVAGALAGLIGHAQIFVSGGAEHQGPDGGGPVAIIAARAA